MTADEFDALPPHRWDQRFRYELIRGVLVVSPFPSVVEADLDDYLGYLIRSYRDRHTIGEGSCATLPSQYVIGGVNRRLAHRAIWVGLGRIPDVETDLPAILVDLVTARRRDALRDYEAKRDEYLAAGVLEYWIIDRFRRIMTVYRPGRISPTYDLVTEGQTYRTDLLPGFELPLARLLAKADDWAKPKKRRRPRNEEETP